jgi:hypothetical protein
MYFGKAFMGNICNKSICPERRKKTVICEEQTQKANFKEPFHTGDFVRRPSFLVVHNSKQNTLNRKQTA